MKGLVVLGGRTGGGGGEEGIKIKWLVKHDDRDDEGPNVIHRY